MMTPLTLIIDRTFPGVGRIKRASGTTNPKIRHKLSRMLTELYEDGRLDLLRAIRDGVLPMLQVYDAKQRKALDSLPTAEAVRPLADAMRDWIAALDCSEKHRISLGTSVGYLEAKSAKATINDLPAVLEQLRKTLGAEHPRSFNLARSAALAFLRDTVKRSHRLYAAVRDVEPRKVPKRAPRPDLTPDWMRNTFPHPETDRVDAIAWAMALTGMGAGEFWGHWTVMRDRIRIYGTKREARVRDVPLVRAIARPDLHHRTFEDKVRERTGRQIEPYDLRRCFSRWMESSAIPRIRRKMYLGHHVGDVTELYERHELEAYLAEDATKIRKHVGLTDPSAPALRLEKAE